MMHLKRDKKIGKSDIDEFISYFSFPSKGRFTSSFRKMKQKSFILSAW